MGINSSWQDLKRLIRFLHPLDPTLENREAPEPEVSLEVDLVANRPKDEAALAGEMEYCPAARHLLSLNSDQSRRGQASQLRKIAHIVGAWDWHLVDWASVRETEFAGILDVLRHREKTAASFNAARAAFRGVMRAGMGMGLVEEAVFTRCISLVKGKRREIESAKGRYIPLQEQAAAVRHVAEITPKHQVERDIAIVRLALDLGLRRAEFTGLHLKSVNFSGKEISVMGKGGRCRELPISDETLSCLEQWVARRGHWSGPLFNPIRKNGAISRTPLSDQSVYQIITKAASALPVGFSPHDCRRTFISDMIEATSDLTLARDFAGHSSVETTAIYDRRDRKIKKRALRQLSEYRRRDSGESNQ